MVVFLLFSFAGLFFVFAWEHRAELWNWWYWNAVWPRIPLTRPKIIRDLHTWASRWDLDTRLYPGSMDFVEKKFELFMGLPLYEVLGIGKDAIVADIMWKQDTQLDLIQFKFRLVGNPKWHYKEVAKEWFVRHP